jgi:tRNA modification GTPase
MFRVPIADTIIAVSTPSGRGGIGTVRLSGPDSLRIALSVFWPARRIRSLPSHRALVGRFVDPLTRAAFDEGILLYFKKPRSYTREDVVELSAHGSPAILQEIVRLGIAAGARPARPGEYTERAFINGRYDIIQAEAVNGLIQSESPASARAAFSQVEGGLSKRIHSFRRGLIEALADLEAAVEFPEEHPQEAKGQAVRKISTLAAEIEDLVSSYETGRMLLRGAVLALVGRTNVGKSTLFNAILGEERAIVDPQAGTTRDYLKERTLIQNTPFTLVDMAGLSGPASRLGKKGVQRAADVADKSDGLLLLLDSSQAASSEDFALLTRYQRKKALIVFNKTDLPRRMDVRAVKRTFRGLPSVAVSALKGTNVRSLRKKLLETFSPIARDGGLIIFHERQKRILEAVLRRLRSGLTTLDEGYSEEVCAEEVRESVNLIGQLTGEIRDEEVIADIFARFCVGK